MNCTVKSCLKDQKKSFIKGEALDKGLGEGGELSSLRALWASTRSWTQYPVLHAMPDPEPERCRATLRRLTQDEL